MGLSFLNVTFVGNVTRDPEMRYSEKGTAITRLGVAVNQWAKGKNDESGRDYPLWLNVTVLGKRAEIVNQYVTKGAQVAVTARLDFDLETGCPRVFQRKDGTYGAAFEVTADSIQFSNPKKDTEGEEGSEPQQLPF